MFAVSSEPRIEAGRVFNIQRCSVHDGPGIRTTVFFKGCPLHCSWCHNPEGIDDEPSLLLRADRCLECRACSDACPVDGGGAVPAGDDWDRHRCIRCGACVDVCPTGAREMAGRELSVVELVAEVERDRVFFDVSGGGVSFSGGEPLSQAAFLMECLEECRRRGLHTVVDTCGFAPRDRVVAVARAADLVLFDLKHMDPETHRLATGRDNHQILANLRRLSADVVDLWVRIPLIPGVNVDSDNLVRTGRFLAALPRRHPVHLLPYHRIGTGKTAALGHGGRAVFTPLEPGQVESAREHLEAFGLEVSIGGST